MRVGSKNELLIFMCCAYPVFKTRNLKLTTSDNLKIGAWFVLADPYYVETQPRTAPPKLDEITTSLKKSPTILFFHGNAASRAVNYRVQVYTQITSRLSKSILINLSLHSHLLAALDANVLAIDYRGFADSEGTPDEAGLLLDALASWDWLIEHGATPDSITVMGQSLGTAVASALAGRLADSGALSCRIEGCITDK